MIEYSHLNNSEWSLDGTVAVDLPTKEFLEKQLFLSHANQTMMLIGVSIKSKKDQYNKKQGRELSTKRLAPIVVELASVTMSGTKHEYFFYTNNLQFDNRKYHLHFTLTTVAESEHVHLITSYLEKI